MHETKELTKKLLDHHINDWIGLICLFNTDECGKHVELDKKLTQMLTLNFGFEQSRAPQEQEGGGAAQPSADLRTFEKLEPPNRTEAAKMEPTKEIEKEAALAVGVAVDGRDSKDSTPTRDKGGGYTSATKKERCRNYDRRGVCH